jgi:hypothetical protein
MSFKFSDNEIPFPSISPPFQPHFQFYKIVFSHEMDSLYEYSSSSSFSSNYTSVISGIFPLLHFGAVLPLFAPSNFILPKFCLSFNVSSRFVYDSPFNPHYNYCPININFPDNTEPPWIRNARVNEEKIKGSYSVNDYYSSESYVSSVGSLLSARYFYFIYVLFLIIEKRIVIKMGKT